MEQNEFDLQGQEHISQPMCPPEPPQAAQEPQTFHPPVMTTESTSTPWQMPPLVMEPALKPPQPLFEYTPPTPVVPPQPVQKAETPVYQKKKAAPKKRESKVWKRVASVALVVVLVAFGCGTTALLLESHHATQQKAMAAQIADLEQRISAEEGRVQTVTIPSGTGHTGTVTVPVGDQMTPAQVYQQNLASVVLVQNVISNGYYTSGGTGSGFIISSNGYVVTNYHVVEGGGKLSVITYEDVKHEAKLIGFDKANDVALLKMEGEGFRAAVIGDSDALIVGDQVAAIGNPLGELTSTMTVGYVSAKERDVNTSGFAINMIQTDAAINSGNSGGPLFNMYGHVVGITSAKYSGSSSSGASIEGIGFAIPINDVMPLIEDLMTNGYETGPYLGINTQDMNAEGAAYYGLPMGAYVSEVYAGYCAAEAGMQAKDIIISLGGVKVEGVNDLSKALRGFKAGDTVDVVVSRSGKEVTLSVTLDLRPQQADETEQTQQPEQSQQYQDDYFGLWPFISGWD